MKPYAHYTAEELALDDLFVRWVQHPADEEVAQFWEAFLRAHPRQHSTVETAWRLVAGASSFPLQHLSPDDASSLWGRIRESLSDQADVRPLQPDARSFVGWWYFARTVTAVAGIVFFVGWALWMQYSRAMQTVQTTAGEVRDVRLPDGSEVHLAERSELRYARQWPDETPDTPCPRAVWLRGIAEFTVAERLAPIALPLRAPLPRPFRVHTPDLTVEATGTCFRIEQTSQGTNVMLRSGEIALLLPQQKHPVRLQPGTAVSVRNGQLYVAP